MDSERLLERIESGNLQFEQEFDDVKVQVNVEAADKLGLLLRGISVETPSNPQNPPAALQKQAAKIIDDLTYIDQLKLIEVDGPAVAAQIRSAKPTQDGFTEVILRGGKSISVERRGSAMHVSKKAFEQLARDLESTVKLHG